jgi:hypothetical protein
MHLSWTPQNALIWGSLIGYATNYFALLCANSSCLERDPVINNIFVLVLWHFWMNCFFGRNHKFNERIIHFVDLG